MKFRIARGMTCFFMTTVCLQTNIAGENLISLAFKFVDDMPANYRIGLEYSKQETTFKLMDSDNQNPHKRMAGWMIAGAWIVLLGLLALFFQKYLDDDRNPNQRVRSAVDSDGAREVVLKRNRQGHYNVTGSINGHVVEFMLDTGATQIAIPASVAEKIGLRRLYQTQVYTANGTAVAYGTELETVSVGDIALANTKAMITTGMEGDIVLLGMGFLKKIEFTQRDDVLILRQYPRM